MYDIGQTCISSASLTYTNSQIHVLTPTCLLGLHYFFTKNKFCSFCLCFSFLDGQFPIEISSVTRDHDFLDQDAIEALCR